MPSLTVCTELQASGNAAIAAASDLSRIWAARYQRAP